MTRVFISAIILAIIAGILGTVVYDLTRSYLSCFVIAVFLALIWPQPRRY